MQFIAKVAIWQAADVVLVDSTTLSVALSTVVVQILVLGLHVLQRKQ